MDAIGEHLEAITSGQLNRLLINVPPGTMKSMASAVFFPAWEWGPKGMQHIRFIGASHESTLATRDNMKMRRLITSDWYQRLWPTILTTDQNEKTYFENSNTGWRQSCAVRAMTGRRGHRVLWDDPHSVEDAHSVAALESANRIFRETLPTRLNSPEKSAIIILMQRLNQKDVSGEIITNGLGYEHLCLPMEWEAPRKKTILGFVDPRKTVGELLFPARFSAEVVERDKKIMGSYAVAGQFQQRPSPAGGGIIKIDNFRLWPSSKPIPDFFYILQSYDSAHTEKTTGDPTGCQVWGIFEYEKTRHALLLDCWNEHLGYPALKKRVLEDWQARYGGEKDNIMKPSRRADIILFENKSSGISMLQDLRQSNIPAVAYNPTVDKVSRTHLATPLLEAGVFWVLESPKNKGSARTWVKPFLDQLEQFPAGEHDEMVDCWSQATIYLKDSGQLDVPVIPDEEPDDIDYVAKQKARGNPYG